MKRPIVIEFSGLPNSGKTTLLHNLKKLFKSNNVKAIFVKEPGELIPKVIPRGSIAQTLWFTLEMLQQQLELSFQTDADYILIDRGFYNQLFWSTFYDEQDAEYSKFICGFMEKFSEMFDVKPDYLYIIDVDVDESIKRRISSGEPVTFSKKSFLENYKKNFKNFAEGISSKLYIDTTHLSVQEVATIVYKTIISITR